MCANQKIGNHMGLTHPSPPAILPPQCTGQFRRSFFQGIENNSDFSYGQGKLAGMGESGANFSPCNITYKNRAGFPGVLQGLL